MSDWSEASESGKKCCSCATHTESLIEATESTHLLGSNSDRSDVFFDNFDKIWLISLAFILITGTTIGIYLLCVESGDNVPDIDLIPRDSWNATPAKRNVTVLKLPVEYVLIYQTNTTECENRDDCIDQMKNIQTAHMNVLNEPDILYNFVVAGDGRVYEGRGWEKACLEDKNTSLAIALVGNFNNHPPSNTQTDVLLAFLDSAVNQEKLVSCYHVLVDHLNRRYFIDLATVIETHIIDKYDCNLK